MILQSKYTKLCTLGTCFCFSFYILTGNDSFKYKMDREKSKLRDLHMTSLKTVLQNTGSKHCTFTADLKPPSSLGPQPGIPVHGCTTLRSLWTIHRPIGYWELRVLDTFDLRYSEDERVNRVRTTTAGATAWP